MNNASDLLKPRFPCTTCGEPTLAAILSQYGARCFGCYEAFCREPQRTVDVGDNRLGDPKAWAYALQRREAAGERLSITQKAMWRRALKYHEPDPTTTEETPE